MTGADLEARLLSAGIAASVKTNEHRGAHEREDGAFDTLTLHLPDGSITIGAAGENAYDVWLEASNEPARPSLSRRREAEYQTERAAILSTGVGIARLRLKDAADTDAIAAREALDEAADETHKLLRRHLLEAGHPEEKVDAFLGVRA